MADMKRRNVIIGAAALALCAAAPAAANDARDMARLSAYLNAIGTLTGNFVQIAPDGRVSEGLFYMRRPGRLRFEYAEPNPTLVVADGTWVALLDRELGETDRYPLGSTPLNLLLKERVDLAAEGAVRRIERSAGQIRVTASDPQSDTEGSITMIFNDNPLELRQWIVTDAQGENTTVALRDTRSNVAISAEKFFIEELGGPTTGNDR